MTQGKMFRMTATLTGAALLAGAFGAAPAEAARSGMKSGAQVRVILARQSYTDVIANLENDGYRVVKMTSTMLGRVKIIAQNRVHLREIVVSRSTGEIKHDVILKVFNTNLGDGAAATTKKSRTGVSVEAGGGGSTGGTTGGGVSASVGGSGGVNASVGSGGVSASVGGSGGVNASAGKGGVSASVGGIGVSLGN
ncbi:hypothetical protein [Vannielia litorea]|uniref:Uncharacterized protein n=1 Tax=Vannielia litorea TaxID=1217970 RepID=A0A1N6F6U9_9RHOB|nr:hypothetical protein [Vannielia litorea]SIN90990.1 hypothetical protein SAMN05444002_1425 [Vannielia litorea]